MTKRQSVLGIWHSERLNENSNPHNRHHVRFVDITQEEYEKCGEASRALDGFMSDSRLYAVVVWNYRDYQHTVQGYRGLNTSDIRSLLDSGYMLLNVNRVVLNLLTSVRTYLDFTETRLKRKYGDDSENWSAFHKACSQAYDQHFSYKFLYKLRNYSQHCGLPINDVTYQVSSPKYEPTRPAKQLDFWTRRDTLLDEWDGWGSVRQELAEQPPLIDVGAHIDVMMQSLKEINNDYARHEFITLSVYATYIDSIVRRCFRDEDGAVGLYEIDIDENGRAFTSETSSFSGSELPMGIVYAVLEGRLEDLMRNVNKERHV